MSPATEEFAHRINAGFNQLDAEMNSGGRSRAVREAEAMAVAAVLFLQQAIGPAATMTLLDELRAV